MKKLTHLLPLFFALCSVFSFSSCSSDDDDSIDVPRQKYETIKINGVDYACFGYSSLITYESSFDLSDNSGVINLPCGDLDKAKDGEYDYDYMYSIKFEGGKRFKKGVKVESFDDVYLWTSEKPFGQSDYENGSAEIKEVGKDYIKVEFSNFSFRNSYTFSGIVTLAFDED